MNELLLIATKETDSIDELGIHIQNSVPEGSWSSKGSTKINTGEWELSSVENPSYIRVPAAGTPNPLGEDCRIVLEATINNQIGNQLIMVGKWLQAGGNGELAFVRDSTGRLSLSVGSIHENQNIATGGFIEIGKRFKIEYSYNNKIVRVWFNNELVFTSGSLVDRSPGVDWVVGSYLDSRNIIIPYPSAAKADWILHLLSVKKM